MTIALVLTARPSYAKIRPILSALVARGVDVSLISCASALLERYGNVAAVAQADFPSIHHEAVYSTYEGSSLLTSAKETGALLVELCAVLSRLRPDAVGVIADRHEVLAAAQSAAYLHLPLVHIQGGERSGSIDDKVRDAITHLADWHCVATHRAQMRVYSLTGIAERVVLTGCPSIDVAREALDDQPVTYDELGGSGAVLDLAKPFVVVLQHPNTEEADQAGEQMRQTLAATRAYPRIVLFSGQDAGSDAMMKALRQEQRDVPNLHTIRNLPPRRFLRLLTQSACLVGNSSAGIRECAYLGVPVVNVGSRQNGRERGGNVLDVHYAVEEIETAVHRQVRAWRYPSSPLYGIGDAGARIAEVLCGVTAGERRRGDARPAPAAS